MEQQEIQAVKQRFSVVGLSPMLNRAIDLAVRVAPTDLAVLIQGESGVGKEVFPKIIHQYSSRKTKPYFAVNCGAIPEGTIDSELFGHEKGAFTSATSDHKGYFEEADGGTLFLDEVGELPMSTQVRLLRVLEAGEFLRVGSSKIQKTSVRVVAATNVNMEQAVREGRFREDLYYRLNAVSVFIPPLRERREDIPLLFRKFATDFAEKNHIPSVRLTSEAMELLKKCYWRGNIRQLRNVAEQLSVVEVSREIDAVTLSAYLPQGENSNLPTVIKHEQSSENFANEREILYKVLFDMKKDMDEMKRVISELTQGQHPQYHPRDISFANVEEEYKPIQQEHVPESSHITDVEEYVEESLSLPDHEREVIVKALAKYGNNRRLAARELGISERTLYRRISDYGLEK